jgi:hypothetical protein
LEIGDILEKFSVMDFMRTTKEGMRFEVVTAVKIFFWDVTLWGPVGRY